MTQVKCIYCGEEVEVEESYNIEFDDVNAYEYCGGHCMGCGREYEWKYKYTIVDVLDLEEVGKSGPR